MKIGVGIGITGHVTVEKGSRARGTLETFSFDNLVLDVGWNEIWERWPGHTEWSLAPQYLYLGTSSIEPKRNDPGLLAVATGLSAKYRTSLVTSLPATNTFIPFGDPLWTGVRLQFDYTEGQAAGTWAELGLAFGATYTKPFNRALFRDGGGNPQQVTVLADEYLRVFVELRVHWPNENSPITMSLNGSPISGNVRSSRRMFSSGLASIWENGFPVYAWPATLVSNDNTTTPIQSGTYVLEPSLRKCTTNFDIPKTELNGDRSFDGFIFTTGQSNNNHVQGNFSNYGRPGPIVKLDSTVVKGELEQLSGIVSVQYFRGCDQLYDGTATSGAASTLTNSSATWDVDELAGSTIEITGGTGEGQVRLIDSNTATVITVDAAWDTQPDATTTYRICHYG